VLELWTAGFAAAGGPRTPTGALFYAASLPCGGYRVTFRSAERPRGGITIAVVIVLLVSGPRASVLAQFSRSGIVVGVEEALEDSLLELIPQQQHGMASDAGAVTRRRLRLQLCHGLCERFIHVLGIGFPSGMFCWFVSSSEAAGLDLYCWGSNVTRRSRLKKANTNSSSVERGNSL